MTTPATLNPTFHGRSEPAFVTFVTSVTSVTPSFQQRVPLGDLSTESLMSLLSHKAQDARVHIGLLKGQLFEVGSVTFVTYVSRADDPASQTGQSTRQFPPTISRPDYLLLVCCCTGSAFRCRRYTDCVTKVTKVEMQGWKHPLQIVLTLETYVTELTKPPMRVMRRVDGEAILRVREKDLTARAISGVPAKAEAQICRSLAG